MAPALTSKALLGTLCTTLHAGLHILISPMWGFGTSFVDHGGAASRGLAQASLTIVGVRMGRSVPVCPSSPPTPVPWATGGTGRVTALFCPSQGGHQPCYLVPQLFEPGGTSVAAADLTLTLVSSVSLSALLAATTSSE